MRFIAKYRAMVVATTILSVVLIGVVGAVVYGYYTKCQPCTEKTRRKPTKSTGKPNKHMLELLNLTQEQTEFFLRAKSEFQQKHDSIGCLIHGVSRTIIVEVMSDSPNQNRIDQLTMEFCELQREQKEIMIAHIASVKQMLNSEQKEILCRMMSRMDKPKSKKSHKQQGGHPKTCNHNAPSINF